MADATPSKVCTKCKVRKPLEEFYVERKNKDGRRSHCGACCSAAASAWAKAHPEWRRELQREYVDRNRDAINQRKREQHDPAKRRVKNLRNLYGLTPEAFNSLLAEQDNRCAICRTDEPGGRHNRWNVDHDHTTGRVRGLLCDGCNRALGFMRDNPDTLRAAIAYLERTGRS